MLETLKSNAIGNLIAQSDTISIIILALLFGMSVITWAVFFGKLICFRIQKRNFSRVLIKLQMAHHPHDIITIIGKEKTTPEEYILSETMDLYTNLVNQRPNSVQENRHEWDSLQRSMEGIIDTAISHEESYLSVLSTCAAAAPLLGLLGTVWGLIHSFIRISELHTADIATVAPGIAEALITTFAGLIVAIPALVMYNYLLVYFRRVEKDILTIADRMAYVLQPVLTS